MSDYNPLLQMTVDEVKALALEGDEDAIAVLRDFAGELPVCGFCKLRRMNSPCEHCGKVEP